MVMDILQDSGTWVAAAFILFMASFFRYAMPYITKGLDERSESIKLEIDEAIRLKEEAQNLRAEYLRKQKEIEAEAEAILAQAKKEADVMCEQAQATIRETIERRKAIAESRMARMESELQAQIRRRMSDVAILAAQDVVVEELAKTEDDPYLKLALKDAARMVV